jgi:predicted dehydrogenase
MAQDTSDRIGIALIGAGTIAEYHLAGLASVRQAAVRIVADRDPARATALAQRFGVADATDDIDAALARDDVRAAIVTTPDDTHEAMALRVAAHRKAILLQKPMSVSSESCRRIIAAAGAAGVDLQVSFMHRYFPEVAEARRLIAQGAIGAVTSLRLRNATAGPGWGDWFFRRDRVPHGAVAQLGAHGIDLIEHLFGPIVAVSARTATLCPTRRLDDGRVVAVENADSAWCTYDLASGIVASHEISMIEVRGTDRFRLEIYGQEGTIWLRSERGELAVYAPRRLDHAGWFTPALSPAPFGERQHRRWIDGLAGLAPPEDTAQAGLRGQLVIEAIFRSAAAGGAARLVKTVKASIMRPP